MTCPLSPALLAKIQRFFPENPVPVPWELESPPIGRCSVCNRATWNPAELSDPCLFLQPNGTRCPGMFVPVSDAAGWEAERPLVPKMSLSTLFPSWTVYTPFEALTAWASTADKLERGRAPRGLGMGRWTRG